MLHKLFLLCCSARARTRATCALPRNYLALVCFARITHAACSLTRNYLALAAILYLFFVSPLHSQSRDNAISLAQVQAENLLGLTPPEVFEKLGAPESVYPLRGRAHWQDDVIFYYSSNLYVFFFDNRVWQIRCDHRSKDKVLGVTPGMKKSAIRGVLGKPYHSEDSEDIYLNPAGITRADKGFPVRLRLIYDKDNNLFDIYLYRGDY